MIPKEEICFLIYLKNNEPNQHQIKPHLPLVKCIDIATHHLFYNDVIYSLVKVGNSLFRSRRSLKKSYCEGFALVTLSKKSDSEWIALISLFLFQRFACLCFWQCFIVFPFLMLKSESLCTKEQWKGFALFH